MTTTVTVQACCSDEIEVKIVEKNPPSNDVETIIQNGQKWTGYVYDGKSIYVQEVPK